MMNKKDIVDIGFIESIGSQIENLNDELCELQYNYVLKKLEVFVCSIMNATLNNEDLSKCYDEYKKMGYNESIYIFLKDFYDIKDYCNNLPSVYLSLKTRYMSIDKEKRMISFKNWVQLKEIEANDNITSDQILENLYYTAKEAGFEGQFSEYIKSLCQIKEKKLSLR